MLDSKYVHITLHVKFMLVFRYIIKKFMLIFHKILKRKYDNNFIYVNTYKYI